MSTVRDNLSELYTPIYDMMMIQSFEEYPLQALEGFTEHDDNSKAFIVDDISGLGIWDETEESEAGETEDPILGYPKTYTHDKFTKTFNVSFEAIDDDEYALLKKEGQAKEMGRGAHARCEQNAANVLSTAFTSATNSPDGQFLIDTDHPKNREETGTVYSNLLSGAFSHDNLEAAETQIANNLFTMDGIPLQPTKEIILYHPPALRGAVQRVLSERAMERPSTTMRDINRFVGAGTKYTYKPVEWIYLSSAMGGSQTAWYLVFKQFGYLKFIWRQRPHYVSWTDEERDLYNFKGRQRFSVGADNWRGIFGSTGV